MMEDHKIRSQKKIVDRHDHSFGSEMVQEYFEGFADQMHLCFGKKIKENFVASQENFKKLVCQLEVKQKILSNNELEKLEKQLFLLDLQAQSDLDDFLAMAYIVLPEDLAQKATCFIFQVWGNYIQKINRRKWEGPKRMEASQLMSIASLSFEEFMGKKHPSTTFWQQGNVSPSFQPLLKFLFKSIFGLVNGFFYSQVEEYLKD